MQNLMNVPCTNESSHCKGEHRFSMTISCWLQWDFYRGSFSTLSVFTSVKESKCIFFQIFSDPVVFSFGSSIIWFICLCWGILASSKCGPRLLLRQKPRQIGSWRKQLLSLTTQNLFGRRNILDRDFGYRGGYFVDQKHGAWGSEGRDQFRRHAYPL